MSGRVLRAVCATAVLAAVTAPVSAGAAPGPGPAPGPSETSPTRSERPREDGTAGPAPAEPTTGPSARATPGTTAAPGAGTPSGPAPGASPGTTVDASEAFPGRTPSASPDPGADRPGDPSDPAADPDPSDDAVAGLPDTTAAGAPEAAPGTVPALLTELRTLFGRAEAATETYNATAEKLERQKAATRKVDAQLARSRRALGAGRAAAGRLAREQYRGRSEFSAYLRLLLADGAGSADVFGQGHVIARAAAGRAAAVGRLTKAEKRAAVLAVAARKSLAKQRRLAADQRRQRDSVRAGLARVEARLAKLTPAQLGAVSALENEEVDEAQRDLVTSGALGSPRVPSRRGAEAVAYAVEQIGKPYEWGAEGPDTFDCSGLTMRAWERAGVAVPRTSQEQWAGLPRIPVSSLRPGDLVVYFPEATHVALYIGDGLVVQAPRPGAVVKVSPLASNPLLGAVRPDPEGVPLEEYTRPELPEGASEGSDTGYSGSTEPE
ncbi:NlpC/P60 family protein [Streptomyces sp. AM 2-1-1]|uniref:C40 family peptidase n=1 Tax=Streptomyces sp. AM 2-1-1 TaxID=3028709 RepID=UPI0023B9CF81|nr:NlpC/P60 family protein [Streptomyces sp. AM 2-1-1]WEH39695.1 NlpC/P60 family protein [Streptomyces sp. AM 2-1-1]